MRASGKSIHSLQIHPHPHFTSPPAVQVRSHEDLLPCWHPRTHGGDPRRLHQQPGRHDAGCGHLDYHDDVVVVVVFIFTSMIVMMIRGGGHLDYHDDVVVILITMITMMMIRGCNHLDYHCDAGGHPCVLCQEDLQQVVEAGYIWTCSYLYCYLY